MEKQELIERYFDGTLSPEEQADVRRQMAGDPAFRAEVELHGLALAAIRQEATARLRARLAQKGRELDTRATDRTHWPRWWPAATGVLLVAALLLAWWFWKPAPEAPIPPPPAAPEIQSVPPVQTAPAPAAPAEPASPAVANTRRLFAGAFQPYRDDSLDPASRSGDAPASPTERFLQHYWEGQYADALVAFDSLGVVAKSNDNLLFLRANCLLTQKRAAEAIPILKGIALRDQTRYAAEIPWYLALAQLRAGRTKTARAALQRIASNPTDPHQADAKRLLGRWK